MRKPAIDLCTSAQDLKVRADATEDIERGSLAWARRHIEQVKAGLRDDLGQAYSAEFTRAAEILREHDPVQFNSLRRLLKDKQVRLGEFDRLIHQRQHERMQDQKRAGAAALRTAHAAMAIRPRRLAARGIRVRRYHANGQGLFLLTFTAQGTPPIKLPLANFTARIVTEIQRDDGVNCVREFELEARLKGQTRRFVVAAAQFASLKWVIEKLGARAVIAAGLGVKDRVREAIQSLSSARLVERTVYTHTGWRKLGREWVYLHGGGALSATGPRVAVETLLPVPLAPFALTLPPKDAELQDAIIASLAMLDLAPDRVTVPTLGAVWRSVLGAVDFSVFVYGQPADSRPRWRP